jgi:hypothetical protein
MKNKIINNLYQIIKLSFSAFLRIIFWIAIIASVFALLCLLGIVLDKNFGEDYLLIPIILTVVFVFFLFFYHDTRNSLQGNKGFKMVIKKMIGDAKTNWKDIKKTHKAMREGIKKGVKIIIKSGYKLIKWALIMAVIIALIWAIGGLIAGLSATTIIIILLLLILFK